MIIGVDMDGVVINDDEYRLDTMSKFCFEHGLPVPAHPYAYEIKCDFSPEEQQEYTDNYYFEYIENALPRRYVSEVIHKLKDDGHRIVIITGRYHTARNDEIGNRVRRISENWLTKNDIPYDQILYTVPPKAEAVRETAVDVMIEDKPETLAVLSAITKTFCYDCPYNRGLELPNMTRVFSWYDIYHMITDMTRKKTAR